MRIRLALAQCASLRRMRLATKVNNVLPVQIRKYMENVTPSCRLFPEHEDDCMEAYPLRAWLQVLGLMVMACRLLNSIGDQHYWTIAIILAICDTFTVVVVSQT